MRYSVKEQLFIVDSYMNCDYSVTMKVIKKLREKIPFQDFIDDKMGRNGIFVQVDETMLNYKCKSHRGRSPRNKTDALVIVECGEKITRAYAKVIENKEASTILPLICDNVRSGTKIFTDEHRSYSSLTRRGYVHMTACHKYEFVNKINNAHTQFVESFNNGIKEEIKRRKGVSTV